LLRTLGIAAGLTVGVTAAMADSSAVNTTAARNQHVTVTPFWAENVNPNGIIVLPGGDGEFEPQGGARVDPCTAGGDANTYDRPIGMSAYPTTILGQFNLQEFYCADDFITANTGGLPGSIMCNRMCWRGLFSDSDCDGDLTNVDEWTINFYVYDLGTNLPGALVPGGSKQNFGAATMSVTQGPTGLPAGINPSLVEHSFSATFTAPVALDPNTCYWVEMFFNTNRVCFYLQTLSYEATVDGAAPAQGNRDFLRHDRNVFPAFIATDHINIDMAISLGFVGGEALGNSNSVDGCGVQRFPPANDLIAGNINLVCNAAATAFDNTFATHQTGFVGDPFSCRKSVIDPVDQTAGDVWFRVNPNPNTSFRASLCGTDTLGGYGGGDSLISVFRLTSIPAGVLLTNLTQVTCSDDACGPGLSEANAVALNTLPAPAQNQNFYLRVASFTPVDVGQYLIGVTCPVPVAPNDFCADTDGGGPLTGPIVVPSADFTMPLGTLRAGQNATASTDGLVQGCGGAGNSSRGVWYSITGNGARVLLSTDQATVGSLFDTEIIVYCGSCTAGDLGSQLSCVAYNDDKSLTIAQAELDFCARANQQYFIMIRGFGTAAANTGDFNLLLRQLQDTGGAPLACCDPQVCNDLCNFVIPLNAITENGENTTDNTPGGSITINEACVSNAGYTNTTQFNDGCSLAPPAGEDRRFGRIALGQTITGNLWSNAQQRDRDNFMFEELIPANTRQIVRWRYASEGPTRPRFYDWAEIADFSDCSPFLGFVFQDLLGCPQEYDKSHIFEGSSTNQYGVSPGGAINYLIFHLSNGDGYPCGTNTRYWLTLIDRTPVVNCVEIATQVGDEDEGATGEPAQMNTFDGTGGDDGFTFAEPCYDVDPDGATPMGGCPTPLPGCDQVARKAGCGATAITNGEFLTCTPNTPFVGKVESKVGAQGATRDIDYYKFTIAGSKAQVGLRVEGAYVMTALITNDDCTSDAITYALAATRGHCISGGADLDDLVVLNPGTYILFVFSTDAFVAVGSGAMFADYVCADSVTKYRCTVTASPLPDCTATPVCPGGAINEAEICQTDFELMHDECAALADGNGPPTNNTVPVGDNDGCSEAVFASDPIASGQVVCGTLWSTYQVAPDDIFLVDQDYWTFTVATPSRLTYSLNANGPARALVADTGAPTFDPGNPATASNRDRNGGSLCYNPDVPLRVLDGVDAGACTGGVMNTIYLNAGTYSIIVSPGSVDVGLSIADYPCGMERTYSLTASLAEVRACCMGSDCMNTTQADCTAAGGVWGSTIGDLCDDTYTTTLSTPHTLVSIAGVGTQILGLGDDNVVTSNMGAAFSLFGKSYGPSAIGIGSNGYLVFGNTEVSAISRTFPNTSVPNAMVAPFFHDWDLNAPGSSVWIQTTGAIGSETTVVEWNNVASLDDFNRRATFQVRLLRPTMNIEFCYGTFTNLAKLDITTADGDPITASAGLDDETGLTGENIALDAAFLTGGRRYTMVRGSGCVPPCCVGNADKVSPGAVAFSDVTAVLANFGGAANPNGTSVGDGDCNGAINFADVTSVLANFNSACP
jgi:hypothetical protein